MFEVLKYKLLHPVVQKLDSTIRRISHYPVDKYKENQLLCHLPLERPGPGLRGLFVKLLHLWTKSYGGKKMFFQSVIQAAWKRNPSSPNQESNLWPSSY